MDNVATLRKELRDTPVAEGFQVDSLSALGWYIRKIGELEWEIQAVEEAARQEIGEIELRAQVLTATAQGQIDWLQERFGSQAQAFVGAQVSGKKRSVTTLWGRAGYRKGRPKVVTTDEEAALEWARQYCQSAVKVRESLLKKPVMEHVEETGEVPPGVEYVPGADAFYIQYAPRSEHLAEASEP